MRQAAYREGEAAAKTQAQAEMRTVLERLARTAARNLRVLARG